MDDVEKAPKDTATVPPAHCFLSKSPGNPIVPATTDVCLFVYTLSVFIYAPRKLAPKLKYPAQSLVPPSCGWVQEWVLEPLSRAVEPRDQGGMPLSQQLPTATKGRKEMGDLEMLRLPESDQHYEFFLALPRGGR